MVQIERRGFHPNNYPIDTIAGVPASGVLVYTDRTLSDYGVGGRIENGRMSAAGYLCQRAIACDHRLAYVAVQDQHSPRIIVLAREPVEDAEILSLFGIRVEPAAPVKESREELLTMAEQLGLKVDKRKSDAQIRELIERELAG